MSIEKIIKKRTFLIQTELGLSNRERKLIEFQIKELIKQLTLNVVGCCLPTKEEMELTVKRTVKNMRDNNFIEDDIVMWSTGYKLGFINAQTPKK